MPSPSSLLKLPSKGSRDSWERDWQIKRSFIPSKKVWKATKQNTTVTTRICFFVCLFKSGRLQPSWSVAAWPPTKTTHDPDKRVPEKPRSEIRLRPQANVVGGNGPLHFFFSRYHDYSCWRMFNINLVESFERPIILEKKGCSKKKEKRL